jgi:hypothetical protein
MLSSFVRTPLLRALSLLAAVTFALALGTRPGYAQQQERQGLFMTPPEDARTVWFLQARHVASELELDREGRSSLARAYISAREEHLKKVKELPATRESARQFWQIRGEARAALEKALVEAIGEEKGKKAAAALGAFNFLSDHMASDILAAQTKALASVFKYQEGVNKVIEDAQEAGSWEGVREKFAALGKEFASTLSAIFSEQQMAAWKEKYARVFGQPSSP